MEEEVVGAKSTWKKIGLYVSTLLSVFVIGGVLGSVAYWFHSLPASMQLRWNNTKEVKLQPSANFTTLSALDNHDWSKPTVSVYSTPYTAPDPPPITLKDLSNNGQAHAIDAVFKDRTTPQASMQALLSTAAVAAAQKSDPYRANRILVASLAKGLNTMPGDRILWTRVFVQPINFIFAGYTVVATDSRSIKIASIEHTTDTKFSIKASADPGEASVLKPEIGQELGNSQKTSADINEQYENLGIDVQAGFLRIIRESAPGGDVSGNAFVQLSTLTDPELIRCQKLENPKCTGKDFGAPQPNLAPATQEKLALLVTDTNLSDATKSSITVLPQTMLPHCALKAHVWMLYEIRHIAKGRKNYVEGSQKAELQQDGYDGGIVEIVPADDIAPAVWSIKVTENTDKVTVVSDKDPDLTVQVDNAGERKLVFTDYTNASELTHWLKTQMALNQPLYLQTMEFKVNAKQTLTPFKHSADDCVASDGSLQIVHNQSGGVQRTLSSGGSRAEPWSALPTLIKAPGYPATSAGAAAEGSIHPICPSVRR